MESSLAAPTDIDYLTKNGEEPETAKNADPVTKQRLEDALEVFTGGLLESKVKIEEAL